MERYNVFIGVHIRYFLIVSSSQIDGFKAILIKNPGDSFQ